MGGHLALAPGRYSTHCVLSGADALAEVLRRQFRQPLSLDLRHVPHVEARREEQLVEYDAAHAA